MMVAIVNTSDRCYLVKEGKWIEVPIGSKLTDFISTDPKPAPPIQLPMEFQIASSVPGKYYTVTSSNGSVACECQGYMYRGKCKHAQQVEASIKQRIL
jgi:hypothetical protein